MNASPSGPARVVIVGATGMVGGYALRYALGHSEVGSVTAIGRRKIGVSHPKLKEVLHRDFADCSALADALTGQDAVVFCLGTYTGAVSGTELRKVTVDYTVEFARVLHVASSAAAFCFLSGSGADPTGRSRIAFARYKGEAENTLLAAGFSHVYIFRPAYIYPVEPRKEPNFSYRLLRGIYPVFRVLFPNLVIRADDLVSPRENGSLPCELDPAVMCPQGRPLVAKGEIPILPNRLGGHCRNGVPELFASCSSSLSKEKIPLSTPRRFVEKYPSWLALRLAIAHAKRRLHLPASALDPSTLLIRF